MKEWFKKGFIILLILSNIIIHAQENPDVKHSKIGDDYILSSSLSKRVMRIESKRLSKYVRIIYLIPSDSIEKPEYTLCLENAAKHLQNWYYNALGNDKTFALYDPVVEIYQTSHESEWYSTNPNGSYFYYFWNNVLQDGFQLTGGKYNDPDNRWLFYIDANCGCGQCGGCGGSGLVVIGANDLKGLAGYEIDKTCPEVVHSYEPCRYVGGMGHELGHAFGLPHPPECAETFPDCWDHDLMMYGYITYPDAFLNVEDKLSLNNSPFIQSFNIEDFYYPISCMELADTCNFSRQSEISIYYGDSVFLGGSFQSEKGIYYDTISSIEGCDTILITELNLIEPPPPYAHDTTIEEGNLIYLTAAGENIRWYIYAKNTLFDSVQDLRDNQSYILTRINDQLWFAENLNYYTPSGSWYYNYDSIQYSTNFGRLYNFEMARESCPEGWRLPGIQEWNNMADCLGGPLVAGGKLKEKGTEFWNEPNTGASNSSGFNARPGGRIYTPDGSFNMSTHAFFWSSTQTVSSCANTAILIYNSEEISTSGGYNEEFGLSVRCVADRIFMAEGNTLQISKLDPGMYYYYPTQTLNNYESQPDTLLLTVIPPPPVVHDTSICERDSLDYLNAAGQYTVFWYSDAELTKCIWVGNSFYVAGYPTQLGENIFYVTQKFNEIESQPDTLVLTINYRPGQPYIQDVTECEKEAITLNGYGFGTRWYKDFDSSFVDTRDGQDYKAVRIGNQVWMAENLNYYTPEKSLYYNHDSIQYSDTYGRLYYFWANSDPAKPGWNVCPCGWHIPTEKEWKEMVDFLGGDSLAGGKLKEQGTSHWITPNSDATNESGFTALPSGLYHEAEFTGLGEEAYIWSDEVDWKMMQAYKLENNSPELKPVWLSYYSGHASVRCIKDDPYQFLGEGRTLSLTDIQPGKYYFYASKATEFCESPKDTIILTVYPSPPPPVAEDIAICEGDEIPDLSAIGDSIKWYYPKPDSLLIDSRDQNIYSVVEIGKQLWMAENLKFNDPERSWYYNNDSLSYSGDYGRLYNFSGAFESCPDGWRLPSFQDFDQLIGYLGGSEFAGGKLKEAGYTHWDPPNTGADNLSKFTALPGGIRSSGGSYTELGQKAHFWTNYVGSGDVLSYELSSESQNITEYVAWYEKAMSARCIWDHHVLVDTGNAFVSGHKETGEYIYLLTQTVTGCESRFDTVSLTINPIPPSPVAKDTNGCNIAYLTATGENLKWYANSDLSHPIYVGEKFGTDSLFAGEYGYFITQTIRDCESLPDTMQVVIYSVPDVDLGKDTTITDRQEIIIGVPENEHHTFCWDNGSDEASISVSGQDLGIGDHSFWLIVTDSNNCENSDTVVIHVKHFNHVPYVYENGSLIIFPNPTAEFLYISFEDVIDEEIIIRVLDITGKDIIHKIHTFSSEDEILELDISYLSDGLYNILILGERIEFSGSFVKK